MAILKELQDLVVSEREGKTFYSAKLQEAESALSKLHAQASEDRWVWPPKARYQGIGGCDLQGRASGDRWVWPPRPGIRG